MIRTSNTLFSALIAIALVALSGCKDPDKSEIEAYYLACDEAELEAAYERYNEDVYVNGTLTFREKSYPVKFRVRGDTSREKPKKSLRFKFEERFVNGHNSLNLNAEYSDRTYLRQYLSSKIVATAGAPCFESIPRVLFLNDRFYGVYLEVESMNKTFLKRIGYDSKGTFIKAKKDGACLSEYDDLPYHFERKNHNSRGWRELEQLIEETDAVPTAYFEPWLRTRFDYDKLIRFLALNSYISNGSTNYHNYFLYRHPESGLWEFIHWDLDKTLSYYAWMPFVYHRTSSEWESDNVLIERCLINEQIRAAVVAEVKVIDEKVKKIKLPELVDYWKNELRPWVAQDDRDDLPSAERWEEFVDGERNYLDQILPLTLAMFEREPRQFRVNASSTPFIRPPKISWEPLSEVDSVQYELSISSARGFLEAKTLRYTGLTETTFEVPDTLADGDYYWMVRAAWPAGVMDGFNSLNVLKKRSANNPPKPQNNTVRFTAEGSPYFIPKGYVFDLGVNVVIDPGVTIFLPSNDYTTFNAEVTAIGTPEQPIRFFSEDHNDGAFGIRLVGRGTATFKHCAFHDMRIEQYEKSVELYDCTFKNTKHNFNLLPERASLLWTQSGKVTIDRCHFWGNGTGEGMNVHRSVGFSVTNSHFHYLPDAIEFLDSDSGLVRGNHVTFSTDDGIDFNNVSNTLITENVMSDIADKGISIGMGSNTNSRNNRIERNIFIRCGNGIGVKDSANVAVHYNSFVENGNQLVATRETNWVGSGAEIEASNNRFIHPRNEWGVALADSLSTITGSDNLSTRPDDFAQVLSPDAFLLSPSGFPLIQRDGYLQTHQGVELVAHPGGQPGTWLLTNTTGVAWPLSQLNLISGDSVAYRFYPNDVLRPLEALVLISGNDDAAKEMMGSHPNYVFLGKARLSDLRFSE